jgi:choline kinase
VEEDKQNHAIHNHEYGPSLTLHTVVSIAEPEVDSVSPLMRGRHKELDKGEYFDLDKGAKQYRASVSGKRLSGRPSVERLGSSVKGQTSDGNPSLSSVVSEATDPEIPHHRREHLVKQVSAWLKNERARRAARKAARKAMSVKDSLTGHPAAPTPSAASSEQPSLERRDSTDSAGSEAALEQLATILERTMSLASTKSTDGASRPHRKHSHTRKLSAIMKRHSTVSSGEDYFDSVDQLVPSCDAILDNSKTMAYGAGGPESENNPYASEGKAAERRARKEKEAWTQFKYEIVRLIRTLKLKGWRRVSLEKSGEISVERLSGALTNAVYVVSPPKHLPDPETHEDGTPASKKPPPYV